MITNINHQDNNMLIPALIRIGVTGHRDLKDSELIRRSIREALNEIENLINNLRYNCEYTFSILSPLAEGADRLVAEEILKWPGKKGDFKPILEAVLPFPETEYMLDFKTEVSKRAFKDLLDQAKSVKVLTQIGPRNAAYEKVGRYIVNGCDLLIAIWDGSPGKGIGGTDDIVDYALKRKRYIIWIDSERGKIRDYPDIKAKLRFKSNLESILNQLGRYNNEHIGRNKSKFNVEMDHYCNELIGNAENNGISSDVLKPIIGRPMYHLVRANMLAGLYQKCYNEIGFIIYLFAGASVLIVPLQIFFFQQYDNLLWLEVFFISIAVILFILLERYSWHNKWIEYRHLAEQLRAAIFFSLAEDANNQDIFSKHEIPKCTVAGSTSSISSPNFVIKWTELAVSWIMLSRPLSRTEIPIESLRNFLSEAWICDQQSYYSNKCHEYRWKHLALDGLGLLLILATIFAAILHASKIEIPPLGLRESHLTFVAIVLPIAGTTIAGIRVIKEYMLNAERYRHMANQLSEIKSEIKQAKDLSSLTELAKHARDIMLDEHDEWRVVVSSTGKLNL